MTSVRDSLWWLVPIVVVVILVTDRKTEPNSSILASDTESSSSQAPIVRQTSSEGKTFYPSRLIIKESAKKEEHKRLPASKDENDKEK